MMALDFDPRSDFDTILDGAEPISLQRRGGAAWIAIPTAWRYSSETLAAVGGVADVARSDVVWQFRWEDSLPRPQPGDKLLDAAHQCWTILDVSELGARTRLRCRSRNLAVLYELKNRVEIQQAIWADGGGGPEITGWATLRTAVPARIQPLRTTVDAAASPPASTATFRVVLGDDLVLDHRHRLAGQDGSLYRVVEFAQAERIDTLPVATVERIVDT